MYHAVYFFFASRLLRSRPLVWLAGPDHSGDASAYTNGFIRFRELVTPDMRNADFSPPLHQRDTQDHSEVTSHALE